MSLPAAVICATSAGVYRAGPTTDAAVHATIRARVGGGSNIAILSEAIRTGAAGTAAAADINNRRDTELSVTIFSFFCKSIETSGDPGRVEQYPDSQPNPGRHPPARTCSAETLR